MSERGLEGVTLGGLAARAEMSKSGLFAHFRSKEELQLELLSAAESLLLQQVVEPAERSPVGLARLRALMTSWLGWARRSGLPGGCPLYGAVFEVDDARPGPVRDHVVRRHAAWMDYLTGLVRAAVESGDLSTEVDVDALAWDLVGIYLSHHVAERLDPGPDGHGRAMRAFERVVTDAGARSASEPVSGR